MSKDAHDWEKQYLGGVSFQKSRAKPEFVENKSRLAELEAENAELKRQLEEQRLHIKTEIWWLIERGSPVEYASDLSLSLQMTKNPWLALKFPTKEAAEEMLNKSCYGTVNGWRITDHLFYV